VSQWPVLVRAPVELPTLGDHELTLWETLLELAELRPQEWTLIGGQMVLVHAIEVGIHPPRLSTDLEVLVNARVATGGVRGFVRAIEARGFVLTGASPQGVAHRYRRDRVSIDVLAPEGLGPRTDVTTTPPGCPWRDAGTQPNGVVANYRWVSPGSAATAFAARRPGSQSGCRCRR